MYFRAPVVEEIHSTAGHRQQRNGDEPPESRTHRRSDSHLRFHPVADPAGGTAVRDKSLGRVPHSSATINGHTQIPQHIWAEGLDFTLETWITVDRLLIFSIRTESNCQRRLESESRHPLSFHRQHLLSSIRIVASPFRRLVSVARAST